MYIHVRMYIYIYIYKNCSTMVYVIDAQEEEYEEVYMCKYV
jgi:hypothetical protein